jgi:hypothetical protein
MSAVGVWAGPVPEIELASCVSGSPPLRASAAAERAMLDATDGRRFQEAAQARYPLYRRGALVPTQVMMLRRGGRWQYVTLHRTPSGLCFSAVFAAERFDFTPGWLAKYRPRAADLED